ncbi:MAG TPA: transcriptional regulator [Peptococcaceae bacterium]|nr:MAG: Nitrogen regulatory protein P-II [Clostridia bacterium 41_269]HBT20580.1 transcriptional regulator [Peptococcaceae bacterium]
MKLLFIIYDADLDNDVMEMLDLLGVNSFTKWDRVLGKGKNSEPKLDNSVWPGFNCALAVVISDDEQERIVQEFKKFSLRLDGRGFRVFVLPVLTAF